MLFTLAWVLLTEGMKKRKLFGISALCLRACADQVARFSVTEGKREGECMHRQRGGRRDVCLDRSRVKVVNSSRK